MTKFYYIVHATQGDNVGTIDAVDKKDATNKLAEIYGKPVKDFLSYELISATGHTTEKRRIAKERRKEAKA